MAGCLAASVCFVLLFGGSTIVAVWSRVSAYTVWTDVVVIPLYLLLVFPMASVFGLVPAICAYRLSGSSVHRGCAYHVCAGALVGTLIGVFVTELGRVGLGVEDDEGNIIPFIVAWGRLGLMAVPSGAIGGLVFWMLDRRDERGI